jgi:rod shape-determining protein MreD
MTHLQNSWFVIPVSFILAFMLTLLPMPGWAIWLRPAWVLMVLIFWTMTSPERVNVGTAWIVGIVLDVLLGSLLGEHAFALTVITYIVVRMHTRLRMFPLIQQGLSIFLLVLLYQFILFCIQGFIGSLPNSWLYWSSSLTSMLLWPWVYSIMRGRADMKIV